MPGSPEAVEAAKKAVKLFTEALGGKEPDTTPTPPATPVSVGPPPVATDMSLDPGGLTSLAANARKAYQTTSMWMLSVFAAFGLLIFGSLPFTNIGKVTDGPDEVRLWLGLGLAALGLAVAVLAASTVFEPAVTSLGELNAQFGELRGPQVPKSWWGRRWRSTVRWLQPRRTAMRDLRTVLEKDEAAAHLGPNMAKVKDLILQLRDLDATQYEAAKRASATLAGLGALDKAVEAHTTTVTALAENLKSTMELPPSRERTLLLRGIHRTVTAESAARAAAAVTRARTAKEAGRHQARLAAENTSADEYLGHRQQVLLEAHVYRMRGTFRVARRRMVVGAVVTLIGASLYASVLPPDKDKDEDKEQSSASSVSDATWESRRQATVTVFADQPAARQLPEECVGTPLAALRDGGVPPETGPFTVLVVDPRCAGELTVPENQGKIISKP